MTRMYRKVKAQHTQVEQKERIDFLWGLVDHCGADGIEERRLLAFCQYQFGFSKRKTEEYLRILEDLDKVKRTIFSEGDYLLSYSRETTRADRHRGSTSRTHPRSRGATDSFACARAQAGNSRPEQSY